MRIIEIIGIILIIIGIIYILLQWRSRLLDEEADIEARLFSGLILVGFGIVLLVAFESGLPPNVSEKSENAQVIPTPTIILPSTPVSTQSSTLISSTPVSTPISSSKNFAICFPEVSKDRIRLIESGTNFFKVVDLREFKNNEMVIELTEFGNPIGYIKFLIFKDNQVNKIENVVDQNCQEIKEYSSFNIMNEPIDKNILGNMKIKFGDNYYHLKVYFVGGDTIYADFAGQVT